MADPVSVLALLGLIYTGKKLSESSITKTKQDEEITAATRAQYSPEQLNVGNMDFKVNSEERALLSSEVTPSFGVVAPQVRSSGAEIMNMTDRFMTDLNVMNNLSPVPKQQVGPGLGVNSDVPAVGGFQQMFRAMPENVGAYRLTSLPGRSGPAADISGGRRTLVPELGHNRPEKTAFLPSRLPNVPGRAQGQGGSLNGVTVRQEYEKTKRTTNRSETTTRTDGLNFTPAKHIIGAGAIAQDPTRNKSDVTGRQYYHMDQVTPGVSSFYGAYADTPAAQAIDNKIRTPAELAKYGLRLADRRSMPGMTPNAGRMNVREKPINQIGMVTAVRADTSGADGHMNPISGGWTQQYVKPQYTNFNPYKGNQNKLDLTLAQRQLRNNPLALSISE